jgi:hypothetical protein
MAASFPSATSTFVKSHEASNNLVVNFSRNPKEFHLSEWTQYVPVKLNTGYYLEMTVEMAGRLLNSDLADLYWADGASANLGQGNLESHEFKSFLTRRYKSPYAIGELAADQASWDILAHHGRIHAQRMMTARTQAAVTVADTSGSYATGHSLAVSSVTGVTASGYHDQSTTARMDIKRTLDHGADLIRLATLGVVKPDEIMVVVSPTYARRVAVSQEIVDYIKGSPAAKEFIEKRLGPAAYYGLPEFLHGYQVVVEDAVKVTSRKGGTVAKSYIWPSSTLVMCSRPGELEGVEGAPSFSTFTVFLKEEMTVESKHDRDERRYLGRVVDDYQIVPTAPIAGVRFTNVLSS